MAIFNGRNWTIADFAPFNYAKVWDQFWNDVLIELGLRAQGIADAVEAATEAADATAADRQAVAADKALVATDKQAVHDDRVLAETARTAAQGYAAGLNLPGLTAGDVGKTLIVTVGGTGYAVGYAGIMAAGSAAAPGMAVVGDTDTGLAQVGPANSISIVGAGAEVARFVGVAGATNFLALTPSNGGAPMLAVTGASASIDVQWSAKGAGGHYFASNGANQVLIRGPAAATRMVELGGSAGGNPTIGATGGALSITSPALAKQSTLAYASTITLDFAAQDYVIGDLTGPLTLANPSAYPVGQRGEILLHEDVTGGRTVSFGANWIKTGNGTINTAAGKYSIVVYWIAVSGSVHYSIVGGA